MERKEGIALHVATARKLLHGGACKLRAIATTAYKNVHSGLLRTNEARMGIENRVGHIDGGNGSTEGLGLVHTRHVERGFLAGGTTTAGMAQNENHAVRRLERRQQVGYGSKRTVSGTGLDKRGVLRDFFFESASLVAIARRSGFRSGSATFGRDSRGRRRGVSALGSRRRSGTCRIGSLGRRYGRTRRDCRTERRVGRRCRSNRQASRAVIATGSKEHGGRDSGADSEPDKTFLHSALPI